MEALAFALALVAFCVFAVLVAIVQTAWVRMRDRRRARRLDVPFAGRTELRAALPSLVAPQLYGAMRDFRVSSITRALHHGRVLPTGVLTVRPAAPGACQLAWQPADKWQRHGARPWQLGNADIEYIRVTATRFDLSAYVTIRTADGSAVQLATDNAGALRRALAGCGITVLEGPLEGTTRPTRRRRPSRMAALASGLRPSSDAELRAKAAQARAGAAEAARRRDELLHKQLQMVPPLPGQTRTWDDIADFLGITPAQARELLKDYPPAQLARLGLSPSSPPGAGHGTST